uniref:Uncharacterized protein n=1 Tax=Branchiostoma floridae TaxID=7739 RepID=C3Z565_BRAFL|eukprot:XP_002596410.1 hypothetical protein BRAFLDRAFT_121255 [Branchiostoma floridae]
MPGTSQSKRDRPSRNRPRDDRPNRRSEKTTATENMEKAEKVMQEEESSIDRPLAQMSLTTPDSSLLASYSFPTSHELRRIGEQMRLQKIKAQMVQAASIPKSNVVVKEDITEWMARLLDLHGFSIERLSNGSFRVSW